MSWLSGLCLRGFGSEMLSRALTYETPLRSGALDMLWE